MKENGIFAQDLAFSLQEAIRILIGDQGCPEELKQTVAAIQKMNNLQK